MSTISLNSLRRAKTTTLGAAAMAITGLSSNADAAVVISSGTTSGIACASGACTPTSANAILNVTQLQALLALGNVSVNTGGSLASDIIFKAELTWVSASTLTLDAYQSIRINQPMPIAGTGGLTVLTNDGGTGGTLSFGTGGNVGFWSPSSPLTINGNAYTLVPNISTLASDIAANASGFYALAADYNAQPDGTYAHSPIPTTFTGSFEGLGNTISKLSIIERSGDEYVGLFSFLGNGGVLENIHLANAHVSGNRRKTAFTLVGSLAGASNGLVMNATVSGSVSGAATELGGLIGWNGWEENNNGGVIRNSSSSAKVTGGPDSEVGGLLGANGWNGPAGLVVDCFATGPIGGTGGFLGGLVGNNFYGTINFSHATGTVEGTVDPKSPSNIAYIGGLVGINQARYINDSWASGNVTGTAGDLVGGLAGYNFGIISQVYATGDVSGGNNAWVGGLVGMTVSVSASDRESGIIQDAYATGTVTVGQGGLVGGLVGSNGCKSCGSAYADVEYAYSTGQVVGGSTSLIGGLEGEVFSAGNTSFGIWDTTTSGITSLSQGAGSPSNAQGVSGLTNSQLQSKLPAQFSDTIWGRRSKINGGLPYLLANPPA